MKKEFLLCAFLLVLVQWSNAQTVKLYSSTGVLKNTYVTIASAMSASVDGDSLLLSPHTFYESMLTAYADKYIILQGTILGKDTSTINASGNGSVIYTLLGIACQIKQRQHDMEGQYLGLWAKFQEIQLLGIT
jgi:hypothetical protein